MVKVWAVACSDYSEVDEKIRTLLQMAGGMGRYVSKDEAIVVKPNLLLAAEPDKASTTHPAVAAAVGKLAGDEGAQVLLADSPGSGYRYNVRTLQKVYDICGMTAAAGEAGMELNYDVTHRAVSFSEGVLTKRFEFITPVLEADGLINVCKLKTHSFMGMTGAVKNLFGVIPGYTKPAYHAKLGDPAHFAGMLLDVAACIKPRLSVMDAVMAMEGNGPHAGTPRNTRVLLASHNTLAVDVVAGEIMGLARKHNPILAVAEKRGLAPCRIEDVELEGVSLDDIRATGFMLPDTFMGGTGFGRMSWALPLFRSGFTVSPRVNEEVCTACGVCRRACPVEAISIEEGAHACIDHDRCIRCYCCHEMCPEKAIGLRSGLMYRVLNRWRKRVSEAPV
jgi:uncharacterized protein (DUF362 family)/Pyruvate/2-oxoacid:ferredoxin oxidoreductase delta subunit